MSVIQGLVYYKLLDDGTGDIRIISFTPRPADEVGDLLVAEFDVQWLSDFMNAEPNVGNYRLVFDADGTPKIDVCEVIIDTGRHQETFYHVEPYHGEPGIVLKSYPEKGLIKVRVWGYTHAMEDARKMRFMFFVTKPMEPNVIITQFNASVGEIMDGNIHINGLPNGEPLDVYSVWAVSPNENLKVWWTVPNDQD